MEFPGEEPEERTVFEAMLILLSYVPSLYELLSMSQVCKFLRDAVKQETVLWQNIVVDKPLSSRLSDDILLKITTMANGNLKTLVLKDCLKITDNGLQCVVENNPLITKMIIPGCTGLTIEGVIRAASTLTKNNRTTLETLHINGIYNITKQHLSTLTAYLSATPSNINGVPIDVEICPRCDEVRMVHSCSRDSCKASATTVTGFSCKACLFCVPRCVECNRCVTVENKEEGVCNCDLCLDCWLLMPKCCFCNKPYCKRHATTHNCSSVFVCENCQGSISEDPQDHFDW